MLLPNLFVSIIKTELISLKEFDTIIDRMNLAFDSANNLGQYIAAGKILFQMNEELPDDLQLSLEEIDDPSDAKSFIINNESVLKYAIREYREKINAFLILFLLHRDFLFFNLKYGFLHFLHLVAPISFLQPHLKQILMTNRACCAIRFFSGSVIGI